MAQPTDELGTRWSIGSVVLYRPEPGTVVLEAPETTRIPLEVIRSTSNRELFISDDRIYMGNDRADNEVVYRVTGWDTEAKALILERDRST